MVGLYQKMTARFGRLRKPAAAAMIGLASPLLPCGPLYMIFGLALFSGSALKGGRVCDWLWLRHFTAALVRSQPVYADTVQDDINEAAANTAKLSINRRTIGGLASTHYIGYRRSKRLGLPSVLAD